MRKRPWECPPWSKQSQAWEAGELCWSSMLALSTSVPSWYCILLPVPSLLGPLLWGPHTWPQATSERLADTGHTQSIPSVDYYYFFGRSMQHAGSSSLTRDPTRAPCIRSIVLAALHQGCLSSSALFLLSLLWAYRSALGESLRPCQIVSEDA